MSHIKQLLIAIDQLLNVLFGGWADETLSSRAWRWYRDDIRTYPKVIIDALFFLEENHCQESYFSELKRTQLPPEMRP